MSKEPAKDRPSPSAYLAALYRAIARKEYPGCGFGSDYLAEYFLPFHMRHIIKSAWMRAKGLAKSRRYTPGVYEYVLGRTAFFDDVFMDALQEKIPQIVMLGAGYDSRAYRFAERNKGARIIELDTAATQNRKIKLLKKFGKEIPEQVTHVPIDFDKQSLPDVLEQAGYDDGKKTLFLWEGVSMYLERESVDGVLRLISRASNHATAIVFDYMIAVSDDNRHRCYGAEQLSRTMERNRTNESFKFAIDEEKLDSFLDARGLKLVKSLDSRQMEESYLLQEDGTPVGRPNGIFRIAMASPTG